MKKSEEYGLQFIFKRDKLKINTPTPRINLIGSINNTFYINNNQDALAHILSGYLEFLGPRLVRFIISEIPSNFDGYEIEGSAEIYVEIFTSRSTAAFSDTNEGYLELPIEDFITILNEWKDFLNSLPYKHFLSDR